jgi:hypothetical protein
MIQGAEAMQARAMMVVHRSYPFWRMAEGEVGAEKREGFAGQEVEGAMKGWGA